MMKKNFNKMAVTAAVAGSGLLTLSEGVMYGETQFMEKRNKAERRTTTGREQRNKRNAERPRSNFFLNLGGKNYVSYDPAITVGEGNEGIEGFLEGGGSLQSLLDLSIVPLTPAEIEKLWDKLADYESNLYSSTGMGDIKIMWDKFKTFRTEIGNAEPKKEHAKIFSTERIW